MPSIAVLMASYNRSKATLSCLESLYGQQTSKPINFTVFLTDATSSDGTPELVQSRFPDVHLYQVDNDVFWNRSMINSYRASTEEGSNYDFYLLLNDDIVLTPEALELLLSTVRKNKDDDGTEPVVVGALADRVTRNTTYSGLQRRHPLLPGFRIVRPSDTEALKADTMNCNCVLVPREIIHRVGFLDPVYQHSKGDIDFGLRITASRLNVIVAPGHVGTCSRNSWRNSWRDAAVPMKERFRKLQGPKGLPFSEQAYFCRRHYGIFWSYYLLVTYLIVMLRLLLPLRNVHEPHPSPMNEG